MNIDDLTIGEVRKIVEMFSSVENSADKTLNSMVGKKVIVRTYSAGVHFGELFKKSGSEVILKNSRRLQYWKTKEGTSLSAIAKYGVHENSRLTDIVHLIWLEAIEIIPCSNESIKSIEGAKVDQV